MGNQLISKSRRQRRGVCDFATCFTLAVSLVAWCCPHVFRAEMRSDIVRLGAEVDTRPVNDRLAAFVLGQDTCQHVYGVYVKDIRDEEKMERICVTLGKIGRTTELFIHDCTLSKKCIAPLSKLSGVGSLALSNCGLDDECLAAIADYSDLRSLSLSQNEISSKGLPHLGKLHSLKFLSLANNRIDNSCIRDIAKLRQLETLVVTGNGVGDAFCRGLVELSKLDELELEDTEISDASIEVLSRMKLRRLSLKGCDVSGRGMSAFSTQNALHSLDVRQTDLTDEILPELAKIRSLEALWLGGRTLQGEGLKAFADHPKLRSIYLAPNEHFEPSALKALAGNTEIYVYLLSAKKVTQEERKRWTDHFPEERFVFP